MGGMGSALRQAERVEPVRFVKRLGLYWMGMLVMVGVMYGVSRWKAGRVLGEVERQLRAAGEPVWIIDLAPKEEGTGPNGAQIMEQLGRQISSVVDSPRASNETYSSEEFPLPPTWWLLANSSEGLNRAIYPQAVAAMKLPRFDMGVNFRQGYAGLLNSALNYGLYRAITNVMADEALRRHLTGDDSGAFDLVETTFALAGQLSEQPLLVSLLIANGVEAVAVSDLPLMASRLSIGDSPSQVSRQRVKALVDRLMNTPVWEQHPPAALKGEIIFDAEFVVAPELKAFLTRPLLESVRAELLRGLPEPAKQPAVGRVGLIASTVKEIRSNTVLVVSGNQRQLLRNRMIGVALAVALYRSDHGGAYPPNIESLVPGYLSEVPVDPKSSQGKRLQIRFLEQGRRPIVEAPGDRFTLPKEDEFKRKAQYEFEYPAGRYVYLDLSYRETPAPTSMPSPP